jgi:hypothetical protein
MIILKLCLAAILMIALSGVMGAHIVTGVIVFLIVLVVGLTVERYV